MNILVGNECAPNAEEKTESRNKDRLIICILSVLLAIAMITACTFAVLWQLQMKEGTPVSTQKVETYWKTLKLQKGLLQEEILISEADQEQLADLILYYPYISYQKPQESTPQYGGRLFYVDFECNGAQYHWTLTEKVFYCRILTQDGIVTHQYYEAEKYILEKIEWYSLGG